MEQQKGARGPGETPAKDASNVPDDAHIIDAADGTVEPQSPPLRSGFNVASVPELIRPLRQWVAWRTEPPKKPGGKIGKVPIDPHTGRDGSTTDPQTWGTLEEAIARAEQDGLPGIGFVFTVESGVVGVDLDHCRDATTGVIAEWAAEILAELDSYSEVSPTGTGVHAMALGTLPPAGRKKGKVEMYVRGRFFTFTGERVPDTPAQIERRDEQILRVHEQHIAKKATPKRSPPSSQVEARARATLHDISDQELIEKARSAQNGSKFAALWSGDHSAYPSQSEADLALVGLLAFWTGGDEARIDRLFRASGLMRDKWDERRGEMTIGERTIAKALEGKSEFYEPPRRGRRSGRHRAGSTRPRLTDTGNAERYAELFGEQVRYCYPWRKWSAWDGYRWSDDKRGRVVARTKDVIAQIIAEAAQCSDLDIQEAILKWAHRSQNADRRKAMVTLAQSEEGIPILPDQFDRDPFLLNFLNGTLDLRTGTLRPHAREDYITRLVPHRYDANATCPTWIAVLERILPDDKIRAFIQRAIGWSLTGDVGEQVLFFCYGEGANGKSTVLGVILRVLGKDYATQAAPDLLLSRSHRSHPTEIADLFGTRLVVCMEVGEGRSFDETLIKQLTGGDVVKARRMREDFWEFEPTHHLWISGNHKPIVRGTDYAIWRRVLLIPFEVIIPKAERDAALVQKLLAEAPGILAWAVQGCMEWQRSGLQPPEAVRAATRQYREEMDVVGQYLAERVVSRPGAFVEASVLHRDYVAWCEVRGETALGWRAFGGKLTERGDFLRKKVGTTRYLDIAIVRPKPPFPGPPAGSPDNGGQTGQGFDIDSSRAPREESYVESSSGSSGLSGSRPATSRDGVPGAEANGAGDANDGEWGTL